MAPLWRLATRFGEVEFPGPLLTTEVCPCSYCWCGKCGTQRLPQSVFRNLFSAEAREALLETLGGDDLTAGDGESEVSAPPNLTETGTQNLLSVEIDASSAASSHGNTSEETRQQTPKSSAQLEEGLHASAIASKDKHSVGPAAISDSATTEESSEVEDDQNASGSFEARSSQTNFQKSLSGGETSNTGSSASDSNSQLSTTSDDQSSSALSSDLSGGETMNFTRQNDSINSTANFSFRRKKKAMQSTFLYVRTSHWAAKFECDHCERTFIRNSSFVAHTATHASPLQNQRTSELGETSQRVTMDMDDLATDSRSSRRSDVVGHQRNSLASLNGFEFHRRLSALQSTFVDLNVSATNESYQSEKSQKPRNKVSATSEASIGTSSNSVSHQQKSKRRLVSKQSRLLIQKQVSTFICNYCNQSFLKRGNLMIHMRKHLNIRPFRCIFEKCRRQFTSATALAAHTRTAHFEETKRSFSAASSKSSTHAHLKSLCANRRSRKSEKADKLQGDIKNNSFIAHVDTSLINQDPHQNIWSNAGVEVETVKNVAPAGGEPSKKHIRSARPVQREHSQGDKDQAGSLPMNTSIGDQVQADRNEGDPVAGAVQSAASPETPKLHLDEINLRPSAADSNSDTPEYHHETVDGPTSIIFKGCFDPKEIPEVNLGPVIPEPGTGAEPSDFDVNGAGGDFIFTEAAPAVVCVNCRQPLAKQNAEHENSKTSDGNFQEISGPLMYCPACATCQIDLPNMFLEDLVPETDDYDFPDADGGEGPHVDSLDVEGSADPKPTASSKDERRKRISKRISARRAIEELSESSDEDDNADDTVWTEPQNETEDSEEPTDDGEDSDDDDNAAAAPSHELSKINDDDESDEDEQTESGPGQSRQQNVRKKVSNEKPGKRKFLCVECGEGFSGRKALNLHLLEHDPVFSFKCGLCTARFETRKKYLTHQKTHKDKSGRFNCNQCEYSTQKSTNIVRHLRVHSGEKLYTCDDCGKECNQLSDLKRHKRVHNGERPYKCDVCKKTFTLAHVLKTHKRIHLGERPFKCDVCKKTFSDPSALLRHKRVHSGERPYICDVCKMAFTQSNVLKVHKRIHSGERPYKCSKCSRSFTRKSDLQKHQKVAHRKNRANQHRDSP